jgi:tRNA 2-thiouridine synthesizing protein B
VPTLHIVNKSPFERSALRSCIDHLRAGDAILLTEDAVLAARKGSLAEELLQEVLKACAVFGLGPDLTARGIKTGDMFAAVRLVDYGGFVDLVTQYQRTHAWL